MPVRFGPSFAKVFVRLVDWDQATAAVHSGERYEHPSWYDNFTVVEFPKTDATVEEFVTVSVCRWGRGVIPFTWLFFANGDGKRVSAEEEAEAGTVAVSADSPLDPSLSLTQLPRLELPMSFVLTTRPSFNVGRDVVTHVMESMQSLVSQAKEKPREDRRQQREHVQKLIALREANVAALEEANKRREVKAVLRSHQMEEERLVALHGGGSRKLNPSS